MKKKDLYRAVAVALCGAMSATAMVSLAGCKKKNQRDAIVLMTEELSGLFNPFYATSATDQDVVGMTQIGMLSTDSNGKTVAGEEYPTVVLDYEVKSGATESVYTFVLKNNIKFSDGKPLTMNDVLFNMYEYLDPVYTGSSTMYSIKIKGLSEYRLQEKSSSGGSATEDIMEKNATMAATDRIDQLVGVYQDKGEVSKDVYNLSESGMKDAIKDCTIQPGYKNAVATKAQQATFTDENYKAQLLKDYELALKTFKEELESDFKAAKESYDLNTLPYSEWKNELSNDVFKFFLYEGYITPKYEQVDGRDNKLKIIGFDGEVGSYDTQEKAINRIYKDKVERELHNVLSAWGTAGTLRTEFSAKAKEIQLRNKMKDQNSLLFLISKESYRSGTPRKHLKLP